MSHTVFVLAASNKRSQEAFELNAYKWVHSSAYSSVPPDAVVGGNDTDGAMIYVGRAFHNGDTLVAKVIPSKHIAFVSWRGEEIPKEHFEILCGQNLIWEHCYNHVVPENAILCGETSLGQPIYIGRGHYNGSLTVGKISSVHRALFIAYGGSEKRLESYEILVQQIKPTPGWAIPAPLEEKKPLAPPLIAFEAEVTSFPPPTPTPPPPPPSYVPVYPPELMRTPNAPPSTLVRPFDAPPPYTATPTMPMPQPDIKPTYVAPYGSMPEKKFSYTQSYVPPLESLPEKKFSYAETYVPPSTSMAFTPAETYVPPPVATVIPAETYVPPTLPPDIWVAASDSYIPPNAVHAGNEPNLAPIFICRAYHEGHLLPGKYVSSYRCAYVGINGMEIPKHNFEVLVGERYHWVPAFNGNVPPGAVEGGRTVHGEPLYVGRGHHYGSLVPGRVQRSHNCLYIPYSGREFPISNYEVLVRSDYFY